jgi:hypothetical protein
LFLSAHRLTYNWYGQKPVSDLEVTIRLTAAEAVVLDDLLRRYSETDRLTVGDRADQRVLWNLLCLLEREGDRPLWPSLQDARAELAGSD